MNRPGLETQASGRDLTHGERAFAEALEAIYTDGVHDYDAVAARLAADKVALPSGAAGPWTQAVLLHELTQINATLDKAYADHGRGA